MRIRNLYFFLIIFLSACGGNPESITKNFFQEKKSFERLHLMIKEDKKIFVVGKGNIGSYWEYKNKWSSRDAFYKKLTLAQVLKEVGLTNKRYQEYISLFNKTGSERISYSTYPPEKPSTVRILVYRSGMVTSGTSITININEDGSIPNSQEKRNHSSDITPLT